MKRILVFSWFYPPVNSSEGLAAWKLLNSSRCEYLVFTQKRSEAWSYGLNAQLADRANVRTVYADSGGLDGWLEEAWRFFLRNRENIALVMTRSMPPECHKLGLRIKRAFPDIPWIASFGDPIRDNPYSHIDCSLYAFQSAQNRINRAHRCDPAFLFRPDRLLRVLIWDLRHRGAVRQRRFLVRLEAETLARADLLIFNNPSQQRYMLRTEKQREKTLILPHCFDPRLYEAIKKPERTHGEKLRFVFTGQLSEVRSARPLLTALRRLKDDCPDLPERTEFLFYGDMADADLANICRWGLCDLVRFEKPLSYRDSLREAVLADWLVHIDADIGAVCPENVFFAGKLADYFGARTPILAVTMQRGAAADWLRGANALVLSFSANEIKQALYQIVYAGLSLTPDGAFLEGFSSEHTAEIFDREVEKLLYEHQTDPLPDYRRRDHRAGRRRGARARRSDPREGV